MNEPLSRRLRVVLITLIAIAMPQTLVHAAEPGERAPHFELPSLQGGETLALSKLRGKVVWLDFWASWCAPCLESLPQLEEMRRQLPSKDFAILAINLDQNPKKARKFLKQHPVGYASASDPAGATAERFGLETMPTSYLIDREGVVRVVHEGFRDGDIGEIRGKIDALLRGDLPAAPAPGSGRRARRR